MKPLIKAITPVLTLTLMATFVAYKARTAEPATEPQAAEQTRATEPAANAPAENPDHQWLINALQQHAQSGATGDAIQIINHPATNTPPGEEELIGVFHHNGQRILPSSKSGAIILPSSSGKVQKHLKPPKTIQFSSKSGRVLEPHEVSGRNATVTPPEPAQPTTERKPRRMMPGSKVMLLTDPIPVQRGEESK